MAIQQFISNRSKTQVTLFVKTSWNQVFVFEQPLDQHHELQRLRQLFTCETIIRRNDGTHYTLCIQYPNDKYEFHRPSDRLRDLFTLANTYPTCMCYWIEQSNRTVFYSANNSRKFNRMTLPPLLQEGIRYESV